MLTPVDSQKNNKEIVQKLLNLGFFDSNLPEINNSLYKKGIFSKNLVCFIEGKNYPKLMKSFTQRNKRFIEKHRKQKKVNNSLNLYELNAHKEVEFNASILKTLKSLSTFDKRVNSKFKEIKEENDDFVQSFDAYKEINKKRHKKKEQEMILSLFSNYKNFSFDLKSFDADLLKDSPLSTTKVDKLRFYYILNRLRNKNLNKKNEQNSKKNSQEKEPIVWDDRDVDELKEIKYLKKVNKITKNRMLKAPILNNSINNEIKEEITSDENSIENDKKKNNKSLKEIFKNKENFIKYQNEIEKNKIEIEKEKKEVNKIQNLIKDTIQNQRNKGYTSLKFSKLNYNQENEGNNLSDIKEQTFSINRYKNIIPELIKKNKKINFNSTMDKDSLFKSTYFNNIKSLNESKTKNFSIYSKDSSSNIFQPSTNYSNYINNKTTLKNKIFNFSNSSNNFKNISRNFNKTKTSKFGLSTNDFFLKKIPLNEKLDKKKSVLHNLNLKYKSFLEDPKKNSTDNIYSISQRIDDKKLKINKNDYINMINNYLKSKNYDSFILNKDMNLKDAFIFFHDIKDKIKNNDVKMTFRNLKMMDKSEGQKKLNYIEVLDSNLINKENELLHELLSRK